MTHAWLSIAHVQGKSQYRNDPCFMGVVRMRQRWCPGSLGPRPSRDSFTKEGLVSNVGILGCACSENG